MVITTALAWRREVLFVRIVPVKKYFLIRNSEITITFLTLAGGIVITFTKEILDIIVG